jgi:hypothetical protein
MFGFGKKKIVDTPTWDSGYFHKGAKSDWEQLTENKLAYMIEESRLYLQNTFEATNSLTQKAAFLLTLIGGLIGYIFVEFVLKHKQFDEKDWFFVLPLAVYFLILIYNFCVLIKYFLPSLDYEAVGTPPKNLLLKNIMNVGYANIIIKQLQLYQDKINRNREQNRQMAQKIKLCLDLIVVNSMRFQHLFLFRILRLLRWLLWDIGLCYVFRFSIIHTVSPKI